MTDEERKILTRLDEALKLVLQGRKGGNLAELTSSEEPEVQQLCNTVENLLAQYNQSYDFVLDLAKGRLDTVAPPLNSMASPFKQLQADLKHLTWQIHQISEGDLEQKVTYFGDFSDSINRMIESLREKQRISDLNARYLEEMMELNASKDKLFSIIAHDLKNPFSGLINLSDMVLSEAKTGQFEHIEEYAALLKTFSLQGYKLLINLLDWAKVQSNSVLVKLESVSLSQIVEAAKSLNEPLALQKNIAIRYLYEDDLQVIADSNMLQTVLRNLLGNAVKFTPLGGCITISAEKKEDSVLVTVQDNGVGIRPENLQRLFRLDSPFSTAGTGNEFGSGLGLILCRDFLKKMNSEIGVQSEVGVGSRFFFTLPLA